MLSTHRSITCLPAVFGNKASGNHPIDETSTEADRQMVALQPRWGEAEQRLADVDAFFADIDALNRERGAWGFKQHLAKGGDERTQMVVDLRWPAIILSRANTLACYSSSKIVEITGQGALRSGQAAERARVEFDEDKFVGFMRRRAAIYAYWTPLIKASGVPVMEIEYTEARTLAGMERIAAFLGQEPGQFGEWPTAKRNDDRIVSRFTNPGDVRAYLRENDLRHWRREL